MANLDVGSGPYDFVSFLSNEYFVTAYSKDYAYEIWKMEGDAYQARPFFTDPFIYLTSLSNNYLAFHTKDGHLYFLKIEFLKNSQGLPTITSKLQQFILRPITTYGFTPGKTRIVWVAPDHRLKVFDFKLEKIIYDIQNPVPDISALAISQDLQKVYLISSDGNLRSMEMTTDEE